MKKILINCLLTIIPIGLIACNGGSSNNNSSTNTPEKNQENPNFAPLPGITLSESKDHTLMEGSSIAEISAVLMNSNLYQAILDNKKSIALGSFESNNWEKWCGYTACGVAAWTVNMIFAPTGFYQFTESKTAITGYVTEAQENPAWTTWNAGKDNDANFYILKDENGSVISRAPRGSYLSSEPDHYIYNTVTTTENKGSSTQWTTAAKPRFWLAPSVTLATNLLKNLLTSLVAKDKERKALGAPNDTNKLLSLISALQNDVSGMRGAMVNMVNDIAKLNVRFDKASFYSYNRIVQNTYDQLATQNNLNSAKLYPSVMKGTQPISNMWAGLKWSEIDKLVDEISSQHLVTSSDGMSSKLVDSDQTNSALIGEILALREGLKLAISSSPASTTQLISKYNQVVESLIVQAILAMQSAYMQQSTMNAVAMIYPSQVKDLINNHLSDIIGAKAPNTSFVYYLWYDKYVAGGADNKNLSIDNVNNLLDNVNTSDLQNPHTKRYLVAFYNAQVNLTAAYARRFQALDDFSKKYIISDHGSLYQNANIPNLHGNQPAGTTNQTYYDSSYGVFAKNAVSFGIPILSYESKTKTIQVESVHKYTFKPETINEFWNKFESTGHFFSSFQGDNGSGGHGFPTLQNISSVMKFYQESTIAYQGTAWLDNESNGVGGYNYPSYDNVVTYVNALQKYLKDKNTKTTQATIKRPDGSWLDSCDQKSIVIDQDTGWIYAKCLVLNSDGNSAVLVNYPTQINYTQICQPGSTISNLNGALFCDKPNGQYNQPQVHSDPITANTPNVSTSTYTNLNPRTCDSNTNPQYVLTTTMPYGVLRAWDINSPSNAKMYYTISNFSAYQCSKYAEGYSSSYTPVRPPAPAPIRPSLTLTHIAAWHGGSNPLTDIPISQQGDFNGNLLTMYYYNEFDGNKKYYTTFPVYELCRKDSKNPVGSLGVMTYNVFTDPQGRKYKSLACNSSQGYDYTGDDVIPFHTPNNFATQNEALSYGAQQYVKKNEASWQGPTTDWNGYPLISEYNYTTNNLNPEWYKQLFVFVTNSNPDGNATFIPLSRWTTTYTQPNPITTGATKYPISGLQNLPSDTNDKLVHNGNIPSGSNYCPTFSEVYTGGSIVLNPISRINGTNKDLDNFVANSSEHFTSIHNFNCMANVSLDSGQKSPNNGMGSILGFQKTLLTTSSQHSYTIPISVMWYTSSPASGIGVPSLRIGCANSELISQCSVLDPIDTNNYASLFYNGLNYKSSRTSDSTSYEQLLSFSISGEHDSFSAKSFTDMPYRDSATLGPKDKYNGYGFNLFYVYFYYQQKAKSQLDGQPY